MPPKSPSYTTRNAFGIYLLQYRFPKEIRDACPSLVLFRRSLHTRCKREADTRARRWWVIMDELVKRFFHDPAVYARAVELLSRYEALENTNWESVEEYLAGLDKGETALLDKALSHRKAVQLQQSHQSLLEKVALLEKTVEALTADRSLSGSKWNTLPMGEEVSDGDPFPTPPPALNSLPPTPIRSSRSSSAVSIQKVDDHDPLLPEVGNRFVDYKRRQVKPGTLTSIQSKIDLFVKILTETTSINRLGFRIYQHRRSVPFGMCC